MKILFTILILCLSGCIKAPSVPTDLGRSLGNGKIIDAIKSDINDAEASESSDGTTSGQTWFFFVMCGLLVFFGVIAAACKEIFAAICCGVGAFVMVVMPTIIEVFKSVMQGFALLINGTLILVFICLVLWVVYKIFHFVPKKKHEEIKKSLLDDNKDVTTEEK